MDPTPVHLTALPKAFPTTIIEKRIKIKIVAPSPTLFTNSDSMYSDIVGCSLGTKIIVKIAEITHFINEIKLRVKPLKNIVQYNKIILSKK